jgi:hypothetical protein
VNHLVAYDHVAGPLEDIEVGVIARRRHRRTVVAPRDAALAERPRFVAVGDAIEGACLRRQRPAARLVGQRRQLAVRRIDDERRSQRRDAFLVVLALPDRVVVMDVVGGLAVEVLVA